MKVTPIYSLDLGAGMDWYKFYCLWDKLSPDKKRVAQLVGVSEAFLTRAIQGRIPTKTENQIRSLAIHKRYKHRVTYLCILFVWKDTPDYYHWNELQFTRSIKTLNSVKFSRFFWACKHYVLFLILLSIIVHVEGNNWLQKISLYTNSTFSFLSVDDILYNKNLWKLFCTVISYFSPTQKHIKGIKIKIIHCIWGENIEIPLFVLEF